MAMEAAFSSLPLNDKQRQTMQVHSELISRALTVLFVTPRKYLSETTQPTTSVSRFDATQPRSLRTSIIACRNRNVVWNALFGNIWCAERA